MFSLGEKQRVVNVSADVVVFDPATGTERATTAAILATDSFRIAGFGTFTIAQLTDIKCARAKAAALESKDYTIVAPAGVAIGDSIEVRITTRTNRYQGELATNYIGGSRPIVFNTAPLTAITAAAIRTAIVAAWTAQLASFANATFPINVTAGTAAADIRVAATTGYESLEVTKVEIRDTLSGSATSPLVTCAVNVTTTVASEGRGLGKFLEESVRMGTAHNTRSYGMDNIDNNPDLRGSYTQVYFKVSAPYDEKISTLAADNGPLPAQHEFCVFLNEATCLGTNGAIAKLAQVAVHAAGALSAVDVTAIAAPLTAAQERVEALILATDASTNTAALFVA
jgi:hypothetical protein